MKNLLSFKSSFGWIYVEEENKKILTIAFGKKQNRGNSKNLVKLKQMLKNYFFGKNKKLTTDLYFQGTTLQIKIWKELKKIPYGKTRSYEEIAKIVKTSPRYVGNVCGQNKHLLIIPCHRVIRKDGKLGGFSSYGGIKLKKKLLDLEKSN